MARGPTRDYGPSEIFASANEFGAVTKSDSTELTFKGVYVGGGGDVAIRAPKAAAAVTFPDVPAGSFMPVAGDRIMSTNTTATNMVWLNW